MNLQSDSSPVAATLPPALARQPFSSTDVVLQHLKTPVQVASVLHLRDEIDLSVHAAAGPQSFVSLEKKETK